MILIQSKATILMPSIDKIQSATEQWQAKKCGGN